jgi:micrococcal nuclease
MPASRLTRRIAVTWVAAALMLVACDSGTDASGPTRVPRDTPTAAPTAAPIPACRPPYPSAVVTPPGDVRCADPATMESARVVRIVDGDTIEVEIDGREDTVRLFGVDTAERGQRCFVEASARLQQLAGAEVRLRPDKRERDRYGRLLRYLYTPDGASIDAALVAEGLGRAWRQDGALRDAIVALEAQAQAAHEGCLWRP